MRRLEESKAKAIEEVATKAGSLAAAAQFQASTENQEEEKKGPEDTPE